MHKIGASNMLRSKHGEEERRRKGQHATIWELRVLVVYYALGYETWRIREIGTRNG